MEKLKLSMDDLVVESFAPAGPSREVGTVHANVSGPYTYECYNCGLDSDDCEPGTYGCTNTCYDRLTCGVNTCDPNAYTCDGDTCFNDTCSFPQCTKAGIPC
jgi:uncharacterized iron-regulated protein